jgi:hypothetical protein
MTRYHFAFRRLGDPAEQYEMDEGPFTPEEASNFGHAETIRKAMETGKAWVCNYSPIVDASEDQLRQTNGAFAFPNVEIDLTPAALETPQEYILRRTGEEIDKQAARAGYAPNRMDAPGAPECACGRPSACESGWCGTICGFSPE